MILLQQPMRSRDASTRGAFSLVELLAILGVMACLAVLGYSIALQGAQKIRQRQEIGCVNNLKNISLAFRIFATDNNDQHPGEILLRNGTEAGALNVAQIYRMLSNELFAPGILVCPRDRRIEAGSFAKVSVKNISLARACPKIAE